MYADQSIRVPDFAGPVDILCPIYKYRNYRLVLIMSQLATVPDLTKPASGYLEKRKLHPSLEDKSFNFDVQVSQHSSLVRPNGDE